MGAVDVVRSVMKRLEGSGGVGLDRDIVLVFLGLDVMMEGGRKSSEFAIMVGEVLRFEIGMGGSVKAYGALL